MMTINTQQLIDPFESIWACNLMKTGNKLCCSLGWRNPHANRKLNFQRPPQTYLCVVYFNVWLPPISLFEPDELWRVSAPDGGGQWHACPVQRPNATGDPGLIEVVLYLRHTHTQLIRIFSLIHAHCISASQHSMDWTRELRPSIRGFRKKLWARLGTEQREVKHL